MSSRGRTIGTTCEYEGLYHVETGANSVASISFTSLVFCEICIVFNYLTLQVLKKLVLELGQVSSLECESCQMSKHRVPYLLRVDKRVDHSFKLVHSDI